MMMVSYMFPEWKSEAIWAVSGILPAVIVIDFALCIPLDSGPYHTQSYTANNNLVMMKTTMTMIAQYHKYIVVPL